MTELETSLAALKRQEIAAALSALELDLVTVYAEPPEQIAAPAVIVAPARDYRSQDKFCGHELRLRLVCLVPRTGGAAALEQLDRLLDTVILAAVDVPGVSWSTVNNVGLTTYVGGSELLAGSINVNAQL